ncbi:MAG: carbon-nitrogen hydrolase family protein [Acidimicrobiales bacterium]
MLVAAGQFGSTLDKDRNRRLAVDAVRDAARRGAALAVLPEASMCSFGPPGTDLTPYAEPLDGPFVDALAQAAADSGLTIVGGMFERTRRTGRVLNTVVVVGPDGLIGAYRKFHLFDALGWRESDQVMAGNPQRDGVVVFDLGGLRFGIMTCYDLRFPEMSRVLVDAGADVVVVAAHWLAGRGKADAWTTLLRARAIESTSYVVASAQPAPTCAGHSMVVDPKGKVLAGLSATAIGLVTGRLAARRVQEVRAALPVLANRRFSVAALPR